MFVFVDAGGSEGGDCCVCVDAGGSEGSHCCVCVDAGGSEGSHCCVYVDAGGSKGGDCCDWCEGDGVEGVEGGDSTLEAGGADDLTDGRHHDVPEHGEGHTTREHRDAGGENQTQPEATRRHRPAPDHAE